MRESSTKRGYGYAWQQARKGFLKSHCYCAICLKKNKITIGNIVDHIKPHRGDQQLFWDKTNWQTLCKTCHDSIKQRFEKSGTIAGCSVDGVPVDPNHHWNKQG
jgi:5-methylcytosine-specific restriction enzyme A